MTHPLHTLSWNQTRIWVGSIALLLLFALFPAQVRAQANFSYVQGTDGAVNATTVCTAPLVRTFVVSDNFTVADVRIGVAITHTFRGDLQITLQSPNGTRVQLTNGDTGGISGDNFNVILDDNAAQLVNTDSATGTHSTTAPPFQNTFRPRNPLAAFAGGPSNGTWRLEICDLFPTQDNGNFRHAELYLTSTPAAYADLSLTKVLVGSAPSNGGAATWRLSVSNAAGSPSTANSVAVTDNLPVGFTFISATGTGSFNPATGVWSVGSVVPGQTRTIDITGSISATAGATITNNAEITASSVVDLDSTVDNGLAGEDDYATSSFVVAGTRAPGVAPALSCPAGQILFDWDPLTWAAGSTNNSYALGALGQIGFQLANPGVWLSNAGLGGQSPNLQTAVTGGTNNEKLLIELVNLPNATSQVSTTITLPMIMRGAQFRVADLDYAAGQFADRMTVEGRYQGATVIPVLTNGATNYVIGNSAYGDGASDNDSADGNVTVTFSSPIDQIVVYYGNHSLAPNDPGQQAIAIHDITFCRPTTTIAVDKTSVPLSDPFNGTTNPKLIPGATVEYCVRVTNTGDTPATGISASDALPARMTYVAGSMTSGATCAAATVVEDDNNSGGDEADPFGGAVAGTTLTATAATLTAGQSFALKFRMTVN